MKAYILSVAGIVLVAAVVTMICPGGKMGGFVKGATRLFVLVVMVSPLVGWVKTGELSLETGTVAQDEAYFQACAELLRSRDEAEIAAFLLEEYGVSAEVAAKRGDPPYFPLEKITVRLELGGIIDEEARIHIMTRVEEGLKSRYRTEAEVYDGIPR